MKKRLKENSAMQNNLHFRRYLKCAMFVTDFFTVGTFTIASYFWKYLFSNVGRLEYATSVRITIRYIVRLNERLKRNYMYSYWSYCYGYC